MASPPSPAITTPRRATFREVSAPSATTQLDPASKTRRNDNHTKRRKPRTSDVVMNEAVSDGARSLHMRCCGGEAFWRCRGVSDGSRKERARRRDHPPSQLVPSPNSRSPIAHQEAYTKTKRRRRRRPHARSKALESPETETQRKADCMSGGGSTSSTYTSAHDGVRKHACPAFESCIPSTRAILPCIPRVPDSGTRHRTALRIVTIITSPPQT